MFRNSDQNKKYTSFKLKTLDNLLIGCSLTKNSINVIYDRGSCNYSEKQIKDAVNTEILPNINQIIEEIKGKK